MWAKIITIKRTKDLNYFSLCTFNLFNTRVSQFELNYWNKLTFPQHSNLLRCKCQTVHSSSYVFILIIKQNYHKYLIMKQNNSQTFLYLLFFILVCGFEISTILFQKLVILLLLFIQKNKDKKQSSFTSSSHNGARTKSMCKRYFSQLNYNNNEFPTLLSLVMMCKRRCFTCPKHIKRIN